MRRNDWILLAALLALAGALFLLLRPGGAALEARVYHAGKEVATLPLSGAGEFVWRDGGEFVRVEATEGGVRVAASSCPDGLCVRRGAIARAGESVVCLPNRVSVVLVGGEAALDAVAY
ncbi:MAG TPA: NusG domain II-containing protein [Candidatus Pullichristensenella avicola]|nr:NusG domain II-containing protein [Candidatus Pullichristensenella avicola]